MSQSLKILMLTEGLAPWVDGEGAQHAAMLARHIGPLCGELTVAYGGPRNAAPPTPDVVRGELGIRGSLIDVRYLLGRGLPGDELRAAKSFSRALRQAVGEASRFDVVYAQGLTGWAFRDHPGLVVNPMGLPMLQNSHSALDSLKRLIHRQPTRSLLKSAQAVISFGGQQTELIRRIGGATQAIAAIPRGVSGAWLTPRPTPRMAGPLRVLLINDDATSSGSSILQEALAALKTPIALDIVGPWHTIPAGIHDITLCGEILSRERLRAILDASDVLIVPSRAGDSSNNILDALARGRHVIATDVGAHAAHLSAASDCRIIPPTAKALTAALANFAETPPLPQRFDLARYVWSRIATDHIRLFQQIRGGNRNRIRG